MPTAKPGLEVSDPEAYRQKMYDLVGGRDPIEVLSETADTLGEIVGGNTSKQMQARPYEGKWTPNEIIGHLLDAEWTYGYRLRLIYCEDKPTILGMDQELWVACQQHNDREPPELVAAFRAVREQNVMLWRRLSPADMDRFGEHNERGPESLGQMLRMLAGHDLWHIGQIGRYLGAS